MMIFAWVFGILLCAGTSCAIANMSRDNKFGTKLMRMLIATAMLMSSCLYMAMIMLMTIGGV